MRGRLLLSVLMGTVAAVPAAWSQGIPAEQASTELEMLTVEAQRRPQAFIDVPVSLRVLTRAEIEQRIALRPEDAFAATPNAILTSQRGGNDASNLVIRGIGPTAFATDPTVAVYIDDVYVGADNALNARLVDIEQIEILRGPQGTLYGRNAVAGAVNIRTVDPVPGLSATTLRALAGSYGRFTGSATVNRPVGDQSALRLSVFGDISSGDTPNSFGGPNFGSLNDIGFQAKLITRPSDTWELVLKADYFRDSGRKAGQGPFDTVYERGAEQILPARSQSDTYGVSAKSTWTTDFGKLIAVTAYRGAGGDGHGGDLSPRLGRSTGLSRDYNQFTQEVRAVSEGKVIDWTLGAFLMASREKRAEDTGFVVPMPGNLFFPGQPPLPAGYNERSNSTQTKLTAATFADVTWHATDRLDVIAGLRGSYDHRAVDYRHSSTVPGFTLYAPPLTLTPSDDYFDMAARAGLSYALTPESRLYGLISRGFKSGGFNISFAPNGHLAYGSERAINYEVGLKGTIPGTVFGYSLAGFYFDYRDQQVYQFSNFILTIDNAPKSRSVGGEAEISAQIFNGFRLYAGLGYADAIFLDYPAGLSGNESGNRQPLSSRFSTNLSGEYRYPLATDLTLVARVDYNERSSFFWNTANTIREPAYGLVNARIGVEGDGWDVALFARNLADHEYRIQAQRYDIVRAVAGERRTIGLLGRITF